MTMKPGLMAWNYMEKAEMNKAQALKEASVPAGNFLGRYAEYAGAGNYTIWHGDKIESRYIEMENLPDWLKVIVDVARVGGHIIDVKQPPPNSTFWFEIDKDMQLVRFVDRSKQDVS